MTMTSASGTIRGWSVEARCTLDRPKEFDGLLLDKEWCSVPFKESIVGVPRGSRHDLPILIMTDLFSHEAAQALRWWFVAAAGRKFFGSLGIETRLVAYTITYSFNVDRVTDGWVESEDTRREANTIITAAEKNNDD
jgi:hypothetical protein